jgi:hypothetical protein
VVGTSVVVGARVVVVVLVVVVVGTEIGTAVPLK